MDLQQTLPAFISLAGSLIVAVGAYFGVVRTQRETKRREAEAHRRTQLYAWLADVLTVTDELVTRGSFMVDEAKSLRESGTPPVDGRNRVADQLMPSFGETAGILTRLTGAINKVKLLDERFDNNLDALLKAARLMCAAAQWGQVGDFAQKQVEVSAQMQQLVATQRTATTRKHRQGT